MVTLLSKIWGGINLFQQQWFKSKIRRASAHEKAELMRDIFFI